MLPEEVFLSHSDRNRPFVTELAAMMRRHGIPIWCNPTNILWAQQWHDEIGAALRRCDWFVLILSPNAVESIWVKRELLFSPQQNRFKDKSSPLLYQPCAYERLSWTLSLFQMVDFTPTFEQGFRDLLRMWGLGYRTA
jgi:TIR domain